MRLRPLLLGAVILLIAAHTAFADQTIEYLYIEANSGASSGGHVAVKLDDTVYHFQNKEGLLLLQRDDWPRFRHLYADLDNRDIHVARLSVSTSTQTEIKRHLDLFHLQQTALLDRAESTDRDVQLLVALIQKGTYLVQGAGFFDANEPTPAGKSEAPFELGSIEAPGFFELQRQSAIHKRKALGYVIANPSNEEQTLTTYRQGYADQWVDLAQHEIALDFILGRKKLNQTLLIDGGPLPAEGDSKDCSAKLWLSRYQRHLENDAIRLLYKPYPGSGLPLLRALARLEAVRFSLQEERLYLLQPGLSPAPGNTHHDEYLQIAQDRLEAEFRLRLRDLRNRVFCAEEVDDLAYHKLELVGLDLKEATDANQQGIAVRFDHEPTLPNAPGWIPMDPMDHPEYPKSNSLDKAIETRDRIWGQIKEKMRYNLITRNCVTELIKTINSGFENNQEAADFRGHIDPLRSQAFIPFRFFELVLKRYPVESTTKIPSFRHQKLAQLMAGGEGPWVDFLEGNTVTGTLYHPREDDGVFLFFTEESIWLRPLLGAVNLGTAMGVMALGLVGSPVDQGRLLIAGAKGALFSLPEIALWNIRKGSYTEATLRN